MKKLSLNLLLSVVFCTSVLSGNNAIAAKADDKNKSEYDTLYPVKVPTFELQHYAKGRQYYKAGDYKHAYNEYAVSVRLNPSFWQGFREMGYVFLKQGKTDKAIESYLKAISIVNPSYLNSTLVEGKTALKEGNKFLAISKFQKILSLDPAAGRLIDEGVQLMKDDKKSQAQKKFEEAIKIDQDTANGNCDCYADAHYKLGLLHFEKKKYPDAIKEFEQAVKNEPAEFAYQHALGNALYKQSNKSKKIDIDMLNKSVQSYERAYKLNPRDIDNMFNLASAKVDLASDIKSKAAEKEAQGYAREEQSIAKSTESMTANSAEAFKIRAEAERIYKEADKLNNYASKIALEAAMLLEKVTSVNPVDNTAHIYLGDAYSIAGQIPMNYIKAVSEYQRSLGLDSGQTELYYKMGVVYYLASQLKPKSTELPINRENAKLYVKFGKKFYRADMLVYAQEQFSSYLFGIRSGKNSGSAKKYLATINDEIEGLGFRIPDRTTGR